jgi:Helix-turn-helix.
MLTFATEILDEVKESRLTFYKLIIDGRCLYDEFCDEVENNVQSKNKIMKHQELINTPEYWVTKIQIDLFQKVEEYLKNNNMNRTQLAEKLGVTKGYVSQILNGDFDHKISKLVELSLAIECYPTFSFNNEVDNAKSIEEDISSTHNRLKKMA